MATRKKTERQPYQSTREISEKSKPAKGVIITGVRDDFAVDATRYGVTPQRMGSAFTAADLGDCTALWEIFGAVEDDSHVHAVLSRRRRAVTCRRLVFEPPDVPDGDPDFQARTERGQQAAQLCESIIAGDDRLGGIERWYDSLYAMTDCIGRGFSVHEVIWEQRTDAFVPVALEHWPQRELRLGPITEHFAQQADRIYVRTADNVSEGEPIDTMPGKWIVHIARHRTDTLARAALLRTVAWWYMFKRYSAKDWAIFIERYGLPFRKGTYPPGSSDADRAALRKAVIQLGKDAGAIFPEGCDIEFVDTPAARGGSNNPHETHAKFCNSEISKAILGNTLTTEVGSTGGNRALGQTQKEGEYDQAEHDARLICDPIRWQLCLPIVRFNLGDTYPVPLVKLVEKQDDDQLVRAKVDEILTRGIGLKLGRSYFYRTYERPEPEDEEDVVQPPARKVTSQEDFAEGPDDEPAEPERVDAELKAAGIDPMHWAAVHALNRSHGEPAARRYVQALATGSKKKSRAWVM